MAVWKGWNNNPRSWGLTNHGSCRSRWHSKKSTSLSATWPMTPWKWWGPWRAKNSVLWLIDYWNRKKTRGLQSSQRAFLLKRDCKICSQNLCVCFFAFWPLTWTPLVCKRCSSRCWTSANTVRNCGFWSHTGLIVFSRFSDYMPVTNWSKIHHWCMNIYESECKWF